MSRHVAYANRAQGESEAAGSRHNVTYEQQLLQMPQDLRALFVISVQLKVTLRARPCRNETGPGLVTVSVRSGIMLGEVTVGGSGRSLGLL